MRGEGAFITSSAFADGLHERERECASVCVCVCVSARKGNVTAKWRSETLGTNDRKILHGNATFCFNFERKERGKKKRAREALTFIQC